jgi:hypothetical protein
MLLRVEFSSVLLEQTLSAYYDRSSRRAHPGETGRTPTGYSQLHRKRVKNWAKQASWRDSPKRPRKVFWYFMWVVLVVEILNKEHDRGRMHALRRRLREIPGDLHELFRDILTRDGRNRDELLLCVQWILFSTTPLRPEQLYYAILPGTEPDVLSSTSWDKDEIYR